MSHSAFNTPPFVIVPLASSDTIAAFSRPVRLELPRLGRTVVTATATNGQPHPRIHLFEQSAEEIWEHRGVGPWQIEGATVTGIAAVPPPPGADTATLANHFTLTATTPTGEVIFSTPCRIAPVLLASSLDPVEEVLVVRNSLSATFAAELARLLPTADGTPTIRFLDHETVPNDLWMQDTVEIGRVCVPEPDGTIHQTVAPLLGLRARHGEGIETASLDAFVAALFARLPNAVCIQPAEPRPDTRWIDWYGNLEVSPPVPKFPHGRVLTGEQNGLTIHPDLLAFLATQGVQTPPLFLDVGWLTIGHVDETINFVPATDRLDFRALLPSPALARDLLRQAVENGFGNTPVFAGHKNATTAARLLTEVADTAETDAIEAVLHDTRARLYEGLGLDAADIISLPVLFQNGLAVIPNGVNSLVVGHDVFIPDPTGPIVNGEDIFRRAIRERLEPLGLRLHFMDIYEPYHVRSGEIHCGTNAIRRIAHPEWWQMFSG